MTEDDLQAPAIRFERVRLDRGTRTILRDVSFSVPRGSVTAVIGPSGGGKSTLLYAITGELAPAAGVVQVLGETLPRPNARELFALRRRMGVMLQGNGLLTDLSVFENVALPVRTHTPMPEAALHELIIAKLAAVGLGEAGDLMPQQLSGGMARRVALARALVLGPPLMLYDEPLTGLDPIACGVILHLIRQLNDRLGMTSVVITHHVRETLAVLRPGAGGGEPWHRVRWHRRGTCCAPTTRWCTSSCTASRTVRFPSTTAAAAAPTTRGARMAKWIGGFGAIALFLVRILLALRPRPGLIVDIAHQVYTVGARSLPIIAVGGLFVGLVISLQGYRALEMIGAGSALGTALGIPLYRELGPVLAAILFCGRAGSSMAAELGLMRATDQITSLSMMAIDPVGKVVAPALRRGGGERAAADRGVLRLRHPRRLPAGGVGAGHR
jgi:phospholipid/cholesterol/gamma-HCH transport system ATP-binding protein